MARFGAEALSAQLSRRGIDVSRETSARLRTYVELLSRWQAKINLISPGTLPDIWHRHIWDSAQLARPLLDHGGPDAAGIDMGSGAGFPGLVLAALGLGRWTLIESDRRKAAFLREAARAMEISVSIETRRLDSVAPFPADLISARALAPLGELLGDALPFWGVRTLGLFPKGRRWAHELDQARKGWVFSHQSWPSATQEGAVILGVTGLRRCETDEG